MICFLAFSIPLAGCGEKGLPNNPPLEARVISNGGMSVIKGDYLYFVNGYVDETKLTKDDNKAGKVTRGALYRTKLTDTYNDISKDKDGFLTNSDRVVSKIVGFSNGGFHIIDNHIYYATPYMKLNTDAVLQNNRVEFHRVNIDGTKDEVIFVTSGTLNKWTISKVGDTPYLVVYENSKLVSVDALTGKTVGTVEDITSYSILEESEYNHAESRTAYTQTHVIYTRDYSLSLDGNTNFSSVVCSYDIASGTTEVLERSLDKAYKLIHVTSDRVYYTYTSTGHPNACLYKRDMTSSWTDGLETRLTNRAYSSYVFAGTGVDRIIANDDGDNAATWLIEGGVDTPVKTLISSAKTIIGVFGDYAYYADENKLYRVNILDAGDGTIPEIEDVYEEGKSFLLTNANFIDFDNRRIYVYAEYGEEKYYLNYFEENFEESELRQRFVGVFEEADIPEEPEQPEEPEYEGDEVEYIPRVD